MIYRFFLTLLIVPLSFSANAAKGKKPGISCNDIKKTPMTDAGDEKILKELGEKKATVSKSSLESKPGARKPNSKEASTIDSLPPKTSYTTSSYDKILRESVIPGGALRLEQLKDLARKAKHDSKAKAELDEIIEYTVVNYGGRKGALSEHLDDTKGKTFFPLPNVNKVLEEALKKGQAKRIFDNKIESRTGVKKYEVTLGEGNKRSIYEMTVCSRASCDKGGKINEVTSFKPKCGPGIVRAPSKRELAKGLRDPTAILKYIDTDFRCP